MLIGPHPHLIVVWRNTKMADREGMEAPGGNGIIRRTIEDFHMWINGLQTIIRRLCISICGLMDFRYSDIQDVLDLVEGNY